MQPRVTDVERVKKDVRKMAAGRVTHVRQGESTILAGGTAYRLVFPQLTIYLRAETERAS